MTPDVIISNEDRVKRAVELQQPVCGFIEHGWQGNFFEAIDLAKKNNIKPLLGSEVYFVKNRLEKDRTNTHLILLCKNEGGRKQLNSILSEANLSGYYYKPRVDMPLVLSLSPENFWVTTACVGGIWKYHENNEWYNILLQLHDHFKDNLFLEVQYHPTESQKDLNSLILDLKQNHGFNLIAGMDTHMILNEDKPHRDNYLLSRGIEYPDEEGWYMDYPSYETAKGRFIEQGILNSAQIDESLENTNIFQEVEKYDSIIFSKTVKLPTLYPNLTQEEKNKKFTELVYSKWEEEKPSVSKKLWNKYEQEIAKEVSVIVETNMADYFLLDYEIVKKGKELGGSITMTGRGSAPSYYVSKLLGLTTIDRISAEVKLFPERFITKERILAGVLPDIDLNLGTPGIFEQAQNEIMGEGHSYRMLAYSKIKTSGAWKLFARISDVDFDTSNLVSDQIRSYEEDHKNAEDDDKDRLDVHDYIEPKYHDVYDKSRRYLDVVNTLTSHPCAFLLFSHGNIREEFGLIKIKTGDKETICACVDGKSAEKLGLLKNDLLKVAVVDVIYRVYERLGRKPHPLPELIKLCEDNEKVWSVYKNGWTIGINQVEQENTRHKVMRYSPKNISELSSFVAAVRPGFKSNYSQYEKREPFSYGVKTLDNLIQTEQFPYSYMIYQENAMQVLAYATIPVGETYEVVKSIAKKRRDDVYKYRDIFIPKITKKLIKDEKVSEKRAGEIAHMIWKIIEDSAFYSFNASHSYSVAGDSLYGAYLKSHYPLYFYETFLQMMEEDGDKDRLLAAKLEAEKAFGIKFPQPKFGQDNRKIVAKPETNEITSSLKSIKGFGSKIADDLYDLAIEFYQKIYQNGTGNFVDLLVLAEEKGILSSKFEQLIKLNYFDMFGGNKKLYNFYLEFIKGKNRYNKTLTDKSKNKRLPELQCNFEFMKDEPFTIQEQVKYELEIVNGIQSKFEIDKRYACVFEIDDKYTPKILVHVLSLGLRQVLKISKKTYREHPFQVGDILLCKEFSKHFGKRKNENGEWEDVPERIEYYLDCYYVVKETDNL